MKMKFLATAAALASLAISSAASADTLRLSHQWSNKDVRHKVAEIVANGVASANVDLDIQIFGSKSLFKPREQYRPLSRGQLDMTVLPLSYAGGQQSSLPITSRSCPAWSKTTTTLPASAPHPSWPSWKRRWPMMT